MLSTLPLALNWKCPYFSAPAAVRQTAQRLPVENGPPRLPGRRGRRGRALSEELPDLLVTEGALVNPYVVDQPVHPLAVGADGKPRRSPAQRAAGLVRGDH